MDIRTAKAAILTESRQPLVMGEVTFPDALDFGQVLVKIHYSSICGAQINEIDAAKGPDKFLPHLLGHEASGLVIETGPGATTVKQGETVVLHWRPSKGIQATPPSYRWGTRKLNAGWVTTFNDYAVISENRLTVIPADFDLKLAALFGCAVTTAMGVVNNDAKVKIGESVIVFGVGGVGLNLVQCAQMVAAHPIVAIDLHDNKLETARRFGATHAINAAKAGDDLDAALRAIVGDGGADNVFESTGVKSVIELAYELTHADGICVLVGVPRENVSINTLPIHFNKVLTGSHGGDCVPDIDIPRIIRLNKAGKMTFNGMITHEFALDEINTALDLVRSGTAGRVILRMAGD